MARRKLPAEPALQSWDDVDEALLAIGRAEDEIKQLELVMNETITKAKEQAAKQAEEYNEDIKTRTKQVKLFVDAHRAELDGKTKKLNHGATGYRLTTKCVVPRGKGPDVVAKLKALGLTDCIKTEETVIKDVLKKKPSDVVLQTGAYIKREDDFWLEAAHEQLEAAAE